MTEDLLSDQLRGLKALIKKWLNALILEFDVWDVTVTTHEDGCFKKILKNTDQQDGVKVPLVEEEEIERAGQEIGVQRAL